jgi:hypothetical protein
MSFTVEPLGPTHVTALRALLSRDLTHNLYLLGLMEEFGVVCGPGSVPFSFLGRFADDGELTAVVFVGGNGGLVVPSASSAAHVTDLTRKLVGTVELGACLGEKALVDTIAQHLAPAPRFSKLQKLFSVSADDLGPFTNPALRQATLTDLPQLVPMSAACVKEMMQRDPLAEDPEGFPMRVRQRVKSGRTYVLEENGKLLFKLEIGSRSQFGAELEGLFTIPEARNQGHATLCLGQISRFLLSSLPRLTVRIDETSHFATIARKVGWVAGRQQRLLWV